MESLLSGAVESSEFAGNRFRDLRGTDTMAGLVGDERVGERSTGPDRLTKAIRPRSRPLSATESESMPSVGVIMGSKSDWPTMKLASELLTQFGVVHESLVVSAHRTPARMVSYAESAAERGIEVIIAGAGGAAHLPGMVAAMTTVPVLGVPIKSRALSGLDSLLSIVQMPGGIPVATLAIGDAGAKNAALLAVRILATRDAALRKQLETFHAKQAEAAIVDLE